MRIVQVNCVYGTGSTGKIVQDNHELLTNLGNESFVLYGRGSNVNSDQIIKVASELSSKTRGLRSRITGNIYGYGALSTGKIIRKIISLNPDVVHLHCINGYFCNIFHLIEWLRDNRVPTVITLHAEFMYTGNCGYAFDCDQWKTGCYSCPNLKYAINSINKKAPQKNWRRMYQAFSDFDSYLSVIGVSDWISSRASESKVLGKKPIRTVLNGLNESIFYYRENYTSNVRKKVIYVTPYFEDANKGGHWLIDIAKRLQCDPIDFVVVGKTGKGYDLPNMHFIGSVNSSDQMAELYSSADLCVLTSKRETFSMVCAESLCCGTPIVGFCAGAPETIALPEYSEFVSYGDLHSICSVIKKWLNKSINKQNLSCLAAKKYSKQRMTQQYVEVYQELLRRVNGEN